jgi:hypothetical protein
MTFGDWDSRVLNKKEAWKVKIWKYVSCSLLE